MRNLWLRFGCFLTGINYQILQTCSEVSKKQVKKYTAAMIIVMLIWAFVGYTFTQRYLQASLWGSIAGSAVMVIVIVQIERQIILTVGKVGSIFWFRAVIAVMMAFLGSAILDQIIFKNDIELEQISMINDRVDAVLPARTAELRNQIHAMDSAIQLKEGERKEIMEELTQSPMIKSVTDQSLPVTVTNSYVDSNKNTHISSQVLQKNSRTVTSIPNPKMDLIQPLDLQIENLRTRKASLDSNLLSVRSIVENEIKSKVGFLDELKLMVKLISNSTVALVFYLILFFFLLGLELFVVFSKKSDQPIDYDEKILQAQALHKRKLMALG